MTNYNYYTRQELKKAFAETLRQLQYIESMMTGSGETKDKVIKIDTIRRKTLKLMDMVL